MARRWRTGRRRSVRGYTMRNRRGKVVYVGTTNNPRRRAVEHQKSGKYGHTQVETVGMIRGFAHISVRPQWVGHTLS
ncbi:MAG: GIY-YIG nuclease family protein [Acidimicrobiia bacterium]|nr:GIY-YIG nuclease family protein [Acidimicrobiia bacterium]